MSEEANPVAADPAPAADPAVDATLVTDPTPADPPAADPPVEDPAADPNEGKTPEEIEAEAKAKAEAEKAAEGAPEAYADFTMPEGITLDTELADQFKTTAKELNLPQEAAQRIVELAVQMRQRDAEAIVALRAEWIEQTKADKEVGGDKLDASLATAKKAIDAFGSPQFKEMLNQTGFGNNVEFVRFCARAGRAVSEDKVVGGGNSASTPQGNLAERLFPSKE